MAKEKEVKKEEVKELSGREVNSKVGLTMFVKAALDKIISKGDKKEDVLKYEPQAVMDMLNDIHEKPLVYTMVEFVSSVLKDKVKEKVLSKRRGDKLVDMIEKLKAGLKGYEVKEPRVATHFGKIDYYLNQLEGMGTIVKLMSEAAKDLQSAEDITKLDDKEKEELKKKLKDMISYARIIASLFKENKEIVKSYEADAKELLTIIDPKSKEEEKEDK